MRPQPRWNPGTPVSYPVRHRVWRIVFLAVLLRAGLASAQPVAPPVLRGAGTLHDLSPASGRDAIAKLQAVVTYYDATENLLFVQDKTGGVFINAAHGYPVQAGDLVAVDGSVKYGFRAGVGADAIVKVLDHKQRVEPVTASYKELATGNLDCRLVRVSGVVKDAVVEHHPESQSDPLHLDLALDTGIVEVYVLDHKGLNPFDLLGTRVSVVAVAGGSFNATQQMTGIVLYSVGMQNVVVEGQQESAWASLPETDPDSVFRSVNMTDASQRLHLRGTVVYYAPGESAVLEQNGRGIFIQTRQTSGPALGDIVDAYGFPNGSSYVPSLHQAVLVSTQQHRNTVPTPLRYTEAVSGLYAYRLISIEGTVLSQLRSADASSLTLDVDGHVVQGSIQNGASVPEYAFGTRVKMVGICQIETGGPWKEPVRFSLLVRSASDLTLAKSAPWWNVRHLAELLGVLLWLSLLVMAWAMLLRRRVLRQSQGIQRSMLMAEKRSAILQQISLNRPLEEVLLSISRTTEDLFPGAACSFALRTGDHLEHESSKICVYRCSLRQNRTELGEFSVWASSQPSPAQSEVLALTEELLMLAVNTADLHDQLLHRSTHDCLTDLPNRRLCEERLHDLIVNAEKHSGTFSLLNIDVNRFKAVNDRHGHKIGDLFLQTIAKRLSHELRPGSTMARIGGDEFVVLLPACDEESALQVLERLKRCFAQPFQLGPVLLEGSASFGLAVFPIHGSTREELEQHADTAMYTAKFAVELEPDVTR